jgi:hypothetical protein
VVSGAATAGTTLATMIRKGRYALLARSEPWLYYRPRRGIASLESEEAFAKMMKGLSSKQEISTLND